MGILDNFGEEVPDAQEPKIPEYWSIKVARMCMAFTTMLGFPVLQFVGRLAIFDLLGLNPEEISLRQHLTVTVGFALNVTGAAIFVTQVNLQLDFVIGLVGCTAAVAVQFIFPGMMLWTLRSKVKAIMFWLMGGTIMVTGLFVTVAKVVCANSSSDFCET